MDVNNPNIVSKIVILSTNDEMHSDIDIGDNLSMEDLGSLLAWIKLAEREIVDRLEELDSGSEEMDSESTI